MKKLLFVSCICFVFMACEFAGGIISGSLAILTDAAHMFSDVAGFMISFVSVYISQRPLSFSHSYGYHRSEIMGAFMSIFVIWALLIWLNIEAINRIITPPPPINSTIMLVTAIIGFLCNVTNLVALNCSCGSEDNDENEDILEQSVFHQDDPANMTIMDKETILSNLKVPSAPLSVSLTGIYKVRHGHKSIGQMSMSKRDKSGGDRSKQTVVIDSDEDEENKRRENLKKHWKEEDGEGVLEIEDGDGLDAIPEGDENPNPKETGRPMLGGIQKSDTYKEFDKEGDGKTPKTDME